MPADPVVATSKLLSYVLRHRPDKPAAEADTIDAVLAIHTA